MRFILAIFFLAGLALTTASAGTSAAAQEHLRRGEKFLRQGEYDAAIVEFTQAIKVNSEAGSASVSAEKQVGKSLEDPDALQIVVVDKFNATAFFNRGSAWFGKGRMDRALDDFTRAIRLDPRYAPAWMNRGTVRLNQGMSEAAIADFDRAIRLDPEYAAAWYNRAWCKQLSGDNDGAIADYSRLLALRPDEARAWNNLGIISLLKKDYSHALAAFDRAVQLSPDQALYIGNRGLARLYLKQQTAAEQDFTTCFSLDQKMKTKFDEKIALAKDALSGLQSTADITTSGVAPSGLP